MQLPGDVTFFFSCTTATFLLGVPANALVLSYLLLGHNDHCKTTTLIFRFIATTDLLVALSGSPFAVQQLSGQVVYTPERQWLCELIEFSINTLTRLMYFLMSLLAVVRARAIRNPLCPPAGVYTRVLVWSVACFFVLQSLIPLFIRQTNEEAFCGGKLEDTFKNELVRALWSGLGTLLPVGLSVIVMLASNVVSLCSLLRGNSELHAQSCIAKKTAAKMTLMLTTIFFCLHVLGIVKSWSHTLDIYIPVSGYIANGVMFLSAVVDPCVYFLKTPAVWRYYNRVVFSGGGGGGGCWEKTSRRSYNKVRMTDLDQGKTLDSVCS